MDKDMYESAQDELINFLLTPMKKKIEELKEKNKKAEIFQREIDQDISDGKCVMDRVGFCECKDCIEFDIVFNAVFNLESGRYQAMIDSGLSPDRADHTKRSLMISDPHDLHGQIKQF